jgi:riboflavin transporter FmnP
LAPLGGLLAALLLLWAYLSGVQYVIVWESDLTHEIHWYLKRGSGAWAGVAVVVVVFQFVLPFLILLWRPFKESRLVLGLTAATVLLAHLAEVWWLTVPAFARSFGWPEPIAVIAMGGCVNALILWRIAARTGPGAYTLLEVGHGRG